MDLQTLTAISPIDGRYRGKVEELDEYFSEFALIKYRVFVEVEYFISLTEIPLPQLKSFDGSLKEKLRAIYEDFSLEDAQHIKDTEKVTNHDVKAVEYFVKEKFDELGLEVFKEFIHFGLTSQDINNTAVPCSIRDAIQNVYIPIFDEVVSKLEELSLAWEEIPMLARTHGQPASPTRLGKELKVFIERLNVQVELLKGIPCYAKFGGATGNFNAHFVAYPEIEWADFANNFVQNSLGLERSQVTTQIAHYDNYGAIFDNLKRINTILLDLDRDMWTYISMNYFKQKIKKGEVGSSAMPHKVNPIDFENSEGNLGIANAVFEHLSAKLPISRLQRDLTDSTVLRNIGVPIAHTVIALKSTLKGLDKLLINMEAIEDDLEENWAVVAEAIQTILRREGYPNPYEALKELTRVNQKINRESIHEFVETLNVDEKVKAELKQITPQNYTGILI
ncbi:adenylosuccinate lyase [Prolixibacter denitrificans]|uniref:Adenylosuccinate lyase n=1 Tax=Prolixibacter denitrificans TaxID=1541063 RepID=A0A2P8C8W8_9BACT|nr:adenylosuccinate lyase [Prolixibacter denitrificans]PSK81407.1 adenylosuccinate lyase [Prolixibacter denitrificans]GET21122.1 adenylosuccinate lyase [Prolixibacter denitrificans]